MLRPGGGTEAPLVATLVPAGFGGTGVLSAAPARVALALAGGRADSACFPALRGSLRSALLDEVAMVPRGKSCACKKLLAARACAIDNQRKRNRVARALLRREPLAPFHPGVKLAISTHGMSFAAPVGYSRRPSQSIGY